MPAKSKAQQKFMGMVHGLQKGTIDPSDVSDKVKKSAASMKDSDVEDYASTKHKGKPEHAPKKEAVSVNVDELLKNPKIKKIMQKLGIKKAQSKDAALKILNYFAQNPHALAAFKKVAFESVKEERDYKDEYKKFQSSTKSKKYRAELNKYNRQKGTYGNGDGKDASHKGGKIAGFEAESTNRGRAEKSRLKKESVILMKNLMKN